MTLHASGPLSLGDINNELGTVGTISLREYKIKLLVGIPIGTISLSNAYGKSKKVPTYEISANNTTVTEKDIITFTVNTTMVPDTTPLYWMLTTGSVSNIIDFTSMPIGQVSIIKNKAQFTISISEDIHTEGTETFSVSIGSTLGIPLAVSELITIIDSSLSPPPPPPIIQTFDISSDVTEIDEGGSVIFNLSTSNVVNNTMLTYVLVGSIGGNDVTPTTGLLLVKDNKVSFSVTTITDSFTEGIENFTVKIYSDGKFVSASQPIKVNDTSVSPIIVEPTYKLIANSRVVDEGGGISFTVITTDIPDNTVFNYTLSGHVNNNDISIAAGYVTTKNNTSMFAVDVLADNKTEGVEVIVAKLYYGNQIVAISDNVIINDTSLSLIYPGATYEVKPNVTEVPEGGVVTFEFITTNIPDGTVFNYVLSGSISSNDLGPNACVIVVDNNKAVFSIDTRLDYVNEDTEYFIAKIYLNGEMVAGSENVKIINYYIPGPPLEPPRVYQKHTFTPRFVLSPILTDYVTSVLYPYQVTETISFNTTTVEKGWMVGYGEEMGFYGVNVIDGTLLEAIVRKSYTTLEQIYYYNPVIVSGTLLEVIVYKKHDHFEEYRINNVVVLSGTLVDHPINHITHTLLKIDSFKLNNVTVIEGFLG